MDVKVDPYYFDYAASAPPWTEAVDEFTKVCGEFYANPSSIHRHGKEAKNKLLELKKEFCDLLHFNDGRFLFCASGTEANNTIIDGHIKRFPQGKLLIASDVHDSIWYATEKYPKSVKVLQLDQFGKYQIEQLEKAVTENITLVCINHVCNETGKIQPIKELAEMCYKNQIKLLVDGMQSVGHIPVILSDIPCTYYTISGHKFGAVRGTGGAFIRDDEFEPLFHGGKQEWNLRAGTENLAGLASMLAALIKSIKIMDKETSRLNVLKKSMISRLEKVPGLLVNSSGNSLPGMLSISIPGNTGREVVGALSLMGFAVSTGSACHSSQMEPSRIILAMGRNKQEANGSIRISMGIGTTSESVNELTTKLLEIIN